MAERTKTILFDRLRSKSESEVSYRTVVDWPSSIFIEQVLAHLRETACPETCELLFRMRIAKGAKFRIVKPVILDQKKRPEGDRAPCPMCTTNKFLSGALVFLPEMSCCAVIGHCCADKENRDQAAREYKARSRRDFEESFLLVSLPMIGVKGAVFRRLRPAAEEARRLFRKFRRETPTVHKHLRDLKVQRGGYLTVTELMESGANSPANFGPRGLERRGDEMTKEIEFGVIAGQTAVMKDYNPVKEIDDLVRILTSLDATPTEAQAIDFICSMTEKQRGAAVAIIRNIDDGYHKFIARLNDFSRFFTRENIELIGRYGSYHSNPFRIETDFVVIQNRPRITIEHLGERCLLLVSPVLHETNFSWQEAPVPKA